MSDNKQPRMVTFAPVIDGLLVALTGWAAYGLRWNQWSMPQNYLFVLVLGTALAVVLLPLSGAYQSWRGRIHWHAIGHALPGLISVSVILALIGTLAKTTADFSRLWMAYWFALALISMFAFRWFFGNLQRLQLGSATQKRQVLLVGDGELACTVAQKIQTDADSALAVCGFVATGDAISGATLPGPVLGNVEDLESIVTAPDSAIDEVWIAVSAFGPGQPELVLGVLQCTCKTVRLVPDLSMLALLHHAPSEVAGMTVIDLNASPLDGHNVIIKSVFDRAFAAVALLILWPLLCLIALAIKIDSPGPVLFRQQRHGWDGKIIHVLKFRTMIFSSSINDEARQAVKDDPRVTSIGRFLRRSSLDELPQFFNVLRGDMSVVGPRPHPLALNESFIRQIDAYMQRHRVKPGITGWAQIHGLRGPTETLDKMKKRVEYDLYYIEHWSLWLDVKIILHTLVGGWIGKNAY